MALSFRTTAKTVRGTLARVAKLLTNPESWEQGTLATNASGRGVSVHDRAAQKFCLRGALLRARPTPAAKRGSITLLRSTINKHYPHFNDIIGFNDHGNYGDGHKGTTHADVLTVVAAARKAAR